MKVSIVVPVYNSHKALRRQIKYYKRLKLPDDIEIIFMDDGSSPPLSFDTLKLKNCHIYPTGDTRPWTQPCARNMGAKIAVGEYLLMTDIDHILPIEAINAVYNFKGDKMEFTREFAILNNKGMITQDLDTLVKYGYPRRRYRRRKFRTYKHTNTFAMRQKIFWELGGYSEKRCDRGTHPTHDDLEFNSKYRKYAKQGKCSKPVLGPVTYCFPGVAADPKKLFHNLTRGHKKQKFHVVSVKNSMDHLVSMMNKYSKVYYVRYGHGELRVMNGGKDSLHKSSPQLKKELEQSLLIKDIKFIKSATLDYPYKFGIEKKVLKEKNICIEPKSKGLLLKKLAILYTAERNFYNPIIFHYLAAHNPDILMHFINKYIKPKTKMFIGCNDKTIMESLYGKIDCYIQIPESQAYYTINEWWSDVEKNAKKCEVILPAAGVASCVIQKRLWNLDIDAHCIDIGSINDAVEGKVSRGWIKRAGVEQLKRNLNV